MSKHIKPTSQINGTGTDAYATQGGIVTTWSYGFLCYRPERIRQLAAVVRKDGLNS